MDKETIETTNKLAIDFDNRFFNRDMRIHYRNFLININGNGILDVGCGTGRDVVYFTDLKYDCVGIDISEGMLSIARKRKGVYLNVDMENISHFNYKFDGIWCCASLYHLPKKRVMDVLNKFYKVLNKNGILFLAVKEGKGEGYIKRDIFEGRRKFYSFYTLTELLILLNKFEVIYILREKKDNQIWLNLVVRKNLLNPSHNEQ